MAIRDTIRDELRKRYTEERADDINEWLVDEIMSFVKLPWYAKLIRGTIRRVAVSTLDEHTPEGVIQLIDKLLEKVGLE